MRNFAIKFYFLISFFISLGVFAQNSPQIITAETQNLNLGKLGALKVYLDKTGKANFEQVIKSEFQANFVPLASIKDLYASDIQKYWLKFDLKNLSQAEKFALNLQMWEYSSIYWQDSTRKWQHLKSGLLTPFAQRPIQYWDRMIYLPLQMTQNQQNTFYIHCYSQDNRLKKSAQTYRYFDKLILYKYQSAEFKFRISAYFFSFYAGIGLIMAVYMLIFYLFVKDLTYLLFSLFLLHQTLYSLIESGLGVAFIYPNHPHWEYNLISYTLIFTFIFLFLFSRNYLKLWLHLPRYNVAFMAIIASLVVCWFLSRFLNIPTTSYIMLVLIVGIGVNLLANIQSIRLGFKPAIYLLLADIFYLLGALGIILLGTQFSNIQEKIPILNLPLYLGSMLQIILFATGLAYRYNTMRREIDLQTLENERIVREQNQILERKVSERTQELNEANEELRTIEEELRQNMEELTTGKEALEQAYKVIEEKNLIFTHSIRSAEKIQQAILPSEFELKEYFQEHFIIYQPKDVVSGDFYWLAHQANKTFVACVDCTGHGVPGAFMSLIGNALLNEIIKEKKIYESHKILENLHLEVNKALRQQTNHSIEGMDMTICVLEKWEDNTCSLQFSGAKNPIFYSSKGKIQQILGDRVDIGGYQKGIFREFSKHVVQLFAGDIIYLFSDGYIDAPSPNRKKVGGKRFLEILTNIQHLPLHSQKQDLETNLRNHMQNTLQRDDITVLGLKI
jgi:two-component system, sensor histidine kinase LadS